MKKILNTIVLFLITIFSFSSFLSIETNAGNYSDGYEEVPYKDGGLKKGYELVKESNIDGLITKGKASDKIQDIVKYLLGFLTLIAVIYIIYSGFRILTSSGDDETIKNSKKTIIYVIVGILVIWFAWTIANFAIQLGQSAGK